MTRLLALVAAVLGLDPDHAAMDRHRRAMAALARR